MKMDVTVIICTCNRAVSLRETLLAMDAVRVPDELRCELLVVDNASTDATSQVVKEHRSSNKTLRYVYEPRAGKGYAYNTGLAQARGDILLFTDDDVRLPANWIAEMCEPILSGRADAVAGGFTTAPHLLRPWMTTTADALTPDSPAEAQKSHPMIGLNMAFSRKVLERVPAFDTELGPGALGFNDDFFFSAQLEKAGYRIARCFHSRVEHHYDASRLQRAYALKRAVACGRSDAYVEHHWEHRPIRFPRLRLLKSSLKLALLRRVRRRELRDKERVPPWEFELVRRVSFYKQHMVERKRPRNYQKHGLVKIKMTDSATQ